MDSHAKSIGVPKEFLLFPLLTIVASLIGTSTCIEINKKWREPALLWFVIASEKGTNKLGALNLLSGALQEIEEMMMTMIAMKKKHNNSSSLIIFLLKNSSM